MGGQYIVKVQLGSRVFAPAGWAIVATMALGALFIKLGFWQLHRAEEKRLLMAQSVQGQQHIVNYSSAQAGQLTRYQQVRLVGHYDAARQILLDNMPSAQGQPGLRVLTPLHLQAGGVVLVDRGWLPWGSTRAQLPNVRVGDELRQVVGIVDDLPAPGVRAGDPGIHLDTWPQLLNYPRHEELQRLFHGALAKRIVLLNPGEPDGYARQWQQVNQGLNPDRHIAYAVQWFGFAMTLLIIFVALNLKRQPTLK